MARRARSLPPAHERTSGRVFKATPRAFSQPRGHEGDAAAVDGAGDAEARHELDVDDSESALGGGPLRVAAVKVGFGSLV